MSLEQLMEIQVNTVFGASKFLQKVTEAPASISIVTSEDIRRYGYRTLADILRSARGFQTTYDRNYTYLGVRGLARPGDYNTRILLLVDGHRINDNVYNMAPIGTEFPIDVDLIERVEIIRGPSSSMYGANAFFGVVNVIPKRGQDLNGFEVSGEAGSLDTYKGRFTYGGKIGKRAEVLFSGSFYESEGQRQLYFKEYDDAATNNGIAQNADRDRFQQFFTSIAVGDFSLQGALSTRKKLIPTGTFGTIFNDPHSYTNDTFGYLDLRFEHAFQNHWNVFSRLAYDRYEYHGDYVYDYSDNEVPLPVTNKDFTLGDWWTTELGLRRNLGERHKLTVGSEYRGNLHQNQFSYDPFEDYVSQRKRSQTWGVYGQDDVTLLKNLRLSLGLRHDRYQAFGGTTNPRLGLMYDPRKGTTLKFLYGHAFRAPNYYELFYGSGFTYKPNPALRPETIRTQELVFEQYLGTKYRVSVSGFHNHVNGLITQQTDEDGMITFNNVDNLSIKGLDFELEGKWAKGVQGLLSYTLQQAEQRETRLPLSNSPRHLAKLNLRAPVFGGKLIPGITFLYTSRRKTLSEGYANGFLLPSLTLSSGKFLKRFEASVGLYNFTDRMYGDPGAEEHRQELIPQDGRTVRAKLTFRF
jgi:outer membrane receptor for ferrienterochelin and colicins